MLTSRLVSASASSATAAAGSDGKGSAMGYVTERRSGTQLQEQQQQQQQEQQQQQQQHWTSVASKKSGSIEQHSNAHEPRVSPLALPHVFAFLYAKTVSFCLIFVVRRSKICCRPRPAIMSREALEVRVLLMDIFLQQPEEL
jgi:hypothetical protein